MRRPSSRFSSSALLLAAGLTWSPSARAQACCAGGSAVTPARLETHEDALVGLDTKVATVIGSYAYPQRAFLPSPPNTPEVDYEEDLFGAVRFLGRGQGALLVPLVQTYRSTPTTGAHFGGGVGDVNLSARYDFLLAGESLT